MSNVIYSNTTVYFAYDGGWSEVPTAPVDLAETLAGALRWVNMIRGEFCLPALTALPRGRAGAAKHCPLAMALRDAGEEVQVACGRAVLAYKRRLVTYTMPTDAAMFVTCFDRHLLPDLELTPTTHEDTVTTTPTFAPPLTPEQIVDETLEWVNLIRAENNMEPLTAMPRGRHWDSHDCAITRATRGLSDGSCSVGRVRRYGDPGGGGLLYAKNGHVVRHPVPDVVCEFVARFDHGELDHLLA